MLHRACRLARRWSGNTLPNPIADTELPSWSVLETDHVRARVKSRLPDER